MAGACLLSRGEKGMGRSREPRGLRRRGSLAPRCWLLRSRFVSVRGVAAGRGALASPPPLGAPLLPPRPCLRLRSRLRTTPRGRVPCPFYALSFSALPLPCPRPLGFSPTARPRRLFGAPATRRACRRALESPTETVGTLTGRPSRPSVSVRPSLRARHTRTQSAERTATTEKK